MKNLILFVAAVLISSGVFAQKTGKLPSVKLKDLQGNTVDTGSLTNDGNPIVICFWATWCSPCREEMPLFEAMYRLHQKDGFNVVGVAIDNPSRSQPFLDSMDISYPILYAEKTGMLLLEKTGNAQGLLPYSLLLDKNGNVVDQVTGKIDEAQIRTWLKAYL